MDESRGGQALRQAQGRQRAAQEAIGHSGDLAIGAEERRIKTREPKLSESIGQLVK